MNIEQNAMSVTPSVSVVIAVYMVEEYIAQCCHSLFAQTLKNIEYIFVDDCSPDKSMDIVQSVLAEYPDRGGQVKIIRHPHNMGVSRTREDGVKAATGEYIIHCDPDDWVELDMYEQLYNKAVEENADMVLCDIYRDYEDDPKSYRDRQDPVKLDSRSVLASIFRARRPNIESSLCNKLIKRECYTNVEWPKGISTGEDWSAITQILLHPLKIEYVNQAFYHYRCRHSSLSNSKYSKESIDKIMRTFPVLLQYMGNSNDAELIRFWQAGVPCYMMLPLDSPKRVYTNKEFACRYRQYRKCIGKDRFLPNIKKVFLYISTYNYRLAFFLYKRVKKLKIHLR